MLITLTIAIVIALLFGKITIKEIKEYVRKHTEKDLSEEGNKGREGDQGGEGDKYDGGTREEDNRAGGDSSKG